MDDTSMHVTRPEASTQTQGGRTTKMTCGVGEARHRCKFGLGGHERNSIDQQGGSGLKEGRKETCPAVARKKTVRKLSSLNCAGPPSRY